MRAGAQSAVTGEDQGLVPHPPMTTTSAPGRAGGSRTMAAAATAAAESEPERRLLVTEVAALTGVSRERLRTWERRHGFPEPQHLRSGIRTYAVSDVALIMSVARHVEAGYPVGEAIAATLDRLDRTAEQEDVAISLEQTPAPAIALAGTSPADLRVVWANPAARLQPNLLSGEASGLSAVAGRLGGKACRQIVAMLRDSTASSAQLLEHIDWAGALPVQSQSLCWQTQADGTPAVVLVQIPQTLLCADHAPHVDRETAQWAAAAAAARSVLQRESGLASAQQALRELTLGARAFDGLLVLRHKSGLRTATSVRGMVAPRTIEPFRCPALWEAAEFGGDLRWAGPETTELLGLPSYVKLVAVPMSINGQPIGAAVLGVPRHTHISELVGELLHSVAVALAAALVRDRSAT